MIRAASYGGAAAIGVLFGDPIRLLTTCGVAVGITEGFTIQMLKESFDRQRKTFEGYIVGFNEMHEETKKLADKIKPRCDDLVEIQAKLSAIDVMASVKDTSETQFAVISASFNGMVEACKDFLRKCKGLKDCY